MIITDMTITNLRSHRHSEIHGMKKRTWFFGDNNSGKSTILDAIGLTLTGVCRGTDEGGRHAERLITDDGSPSTAGQTQFTIEMRTDKGVIRRTGPGQGPTSSLQPQIDKILGGMRNAARVTVDVQHFFLLEPAGQKEIISKVIDLKVTKELVEQAAGPHWRYISHLPFDSVESLDRALAYVTEKKKQIRTKLDRVAIFDMDQFGDPYKTWTLEQAKVTHERIAKKQHDLCEQDVAQRSGSAIGEAERKSLKEAIDAEEIRLDKLLKDSIPLDRDYILVFSEIALRMANLVTKKRMTVATLRDVAVMAGMRLLMEPASVTKCPCCDRPIRSDLKARRVTELSAEAEKEKHFSAKIKDLEKEMEELQREERQLELDRGKRKILLPQIEESQKRLAELQAKHLSSAAPDADGGKLAARVAEGREILAKCVNVIGALTQNEASETLSRDMVREYDAVEALRKDVLGPTGLRSSLLADRLAEFAAEINKVLGAFGYIMAFKPEPFEVLVNKRLAVLLSPSEKLRAGFALQVAIAKSSGLNFVCLDGVEVLGFNARGSLWRILEKVNLDQVILCATITVDMSKFSFPVKDDTAAFIVRLTQDKGTVVAPLA